MITITHIRYTVKAEYAASNRERIRKVMEELRTLHRPDLKYSVFVEDDGKTFIHLPIYTSNEARNVIVTLEAFQAFQAALHESHPEVPPVATNLTLVDSSYDFSS
jgi:hypothetical protein